ncbi:hypothetical protein vBVhaSMAG7_027 [Vibrio phage vB_VhaS_MAG7]|nr:hypothetical protein vBVhaSMAG7_027 [Vibrio phage vB_VhaS_MAG7]
MFTVPLKHGKDIGVSEFKRVKAESVIEEDGVTSFYNTVNGARSDVYRVATDQIDEDEGGVVKD